MLLLIHAASALTCEEIEPAAPTRTAGEVLESARPPPIQAAYGRAVALARAARHEEAARAFLDVLHLVQTAEGCRVTPARAAELDHDRDLAILGIARVAHAARDYTTAGAWYDRIHRRSPLWPRAQVEHAWGEYVRGDTDGAARRLSRVRAEDPEVPYLELLIAEDRFPGPCCSTGEEAEALRAAWEHAEKEIDQMKSRAPGDPAIAAVEFQVDILRYEHTGYPNCVPYWECPQRRD